MTGGEYGGGNILGDIAGNIILMIGIIIIVALLIGVWLLTKAVNCIVRAFALHPRSKALWVALIMFCLSISLMIYVCLTQTDQTWYSIAETALGLSFIGLVITSRCVELANAKVFERQREGIVTEVIHRPWWNMKDRPQEQEKDAALASI
jgi:hypothetical protein